MYRRTPWTWWQSGLGLKSGKLIGWLCLSPATSLVLQSAAVLVSRPDQVNYLRDTTGEYGLHHVIEQNTTLTSIHLCDRVCSSLLLLFFVFTCILFGRLVGRSVGRSISIFPTSCRDVGWLVIVIRWLHSTFFPF